MTPSRRSFLIGAAATLITAPAIVRASSLMPVKAMPPVDVLDLLHQRMNAAYDLTRQQLDAALYGSSWSRHQYLGYPGGFTVRSVPASDVFAFREITASIEFDK